MAFAVNTAAWLLLTPRDGGPLTTRQASLDAADRQVAPFKEASDAGLRPDPFPDRAASLLAGLLTATRAGLTPAGDDELMLDPCRWPPACPSLSDNLVAAPESPGSNSTQAAPSQRPEVGASCLLPRHCAAALPLRVPEELAERLKGAARDRQESVNGYAVKVLSVTVDPDRSRP
jgi:hypothetical protein